MRMVSLARYRDGMSNLNWQGALRGLVLLALLLVTLAIVGHSIVGYAGCAVIVVVAAVVLRREIGPHWLHG